MSTNVGLFGMFNNDAALSHSKLSCTCDVHVSVVTYEYAVDDGSKSGDCKGKE